MVLLFQERVDFIDVIQAVIHEKFEFRDDSCLLSDLFSKDKPDAFIFLRQALQHLVR